ncbi:XRE family transcriptional regulator [Listeria monocytogenes]|nr:XRE family transcriptional regulator [Listeria monocytogenes]
MDTKVNLNFIKQKRISLGYSQKEMADMMGFKNASTYSKYENGDYKIKAEMLPVLAKILKCNMKKFFTQNVSETETKQLTKVGG